MTGTGEPLFPSPSEETLIEGNDHNRPELAIRDILTPGVTTAVANYAAISILEIAFYSLLPLFYSTSIDGGGLGLTPSKIGTLLGGFVCAAVSSEYAFALTFRCRDS